MADEDTVDGPSGTVNGPHLEYVLGAVSGVGGAVVEVGEAVVTAVVTHVTNNVSRAVSAITPAVGVCTAVSEGVGGAVNQVSHKMLRCLTQPPQTITIAGLEDGGYSVTAVVDAVATPRTVAAAAGEDSSTHDDSRFYSSEEEDEDSLREEHLSICRELGLGEDLLAGDQEDVLHRLVSLQGRVRGLILDTEAGSGRRRALVHTLVALREHKQKVADMSAVAKSVGGVSTKGHLLVRDNCRRNSCDVCTHTIWDIVTAAYICSACRLHVHGSCTERIRRLCPASYLSVQPVTESSRNDLQDQLFEGLRIRSSNNSSPRSSNPASPVKKSTSSFLTGKENESDIFNSSCQESGVVISSSVPSTASSKESLTNSTKSNDSKKRSNRSRQSSQYSPGHNPAVRRDSRTRAGVATLESITMDVAMAKDAELLVRNHHMQQPASLTTLITTICPEVGLGVQNFSCAECKQYITNRLSISSAEVANLAHLRSDSAWSEPRLCNYSGLYYCPACHWHNTAVIPAMAITNWDFVERPVSRCSYQLLHYSRSKPLLQLNTLNPLLYTHLQELCEIKKLREDLLLMKQYLCSCRAATDAKLLLQLSARQHFVDSGSVYSLQDLIDINDGTLLPQLQRVHETYARHITKECAACQGRGHICMNCREMEDVLYPFEQRAVQCSVCYAVMHISCYNLRRTCTKCVLRGRPGEVTIIGAMAETGAPVIAPPDSDNNRNTPPTNRRPARQHSVSESYTDEQPITPSPLVRTPRKHTVSESDNEYAIGSANEAYVAIEGCDKPVEQSKDQFRSKNPFD